MSPFRRISFVSLLLPLPVVMACSDNGAAVAGSGTIEVDQIRISPLYAGRIAGIAVREGDRFAKGDPLVFLQNEEIEADVDFSRSGLEAARSGIAQAQADYENARKERLRGEQLFRSGSLARQDLDRLVTREKVSLSRLQAARAQSGQLEAALRRSKSRVREITLYAPVDGVVLSRNFEIGEVALPGAAILSVADLSTVRLNVYLPGPDLHSIQTGAKASVKVDGLDREFEGIIESIADEAEFTPKNVQTADARARLVYEVRIRLDNSERILKPGMPADARIATREADPQRTQGQNR